MNSQKPDSVITPTPGRELKKLVDAKAIIAATTIIIGTVILEKIEVSVWLLLFTWTVVIIGFVGRVWILADWRRQTLFGFLLMAYLALAIAQFTKPKMVIVYQRQKLDGKSLTLAPSCIPASSVQPSICADEKYPNMFDFFGMGMLSDRTLTVQYVVLDFSAKITQHFPDSSCWKPVDLDGTEYACVLSQEIVLAHLPVGIPPFFGLSESKTSLKVRVRAFYASESAEANFSLAQ